MSRWEQERDGDSGLMSDLARARLDRIKGGGLSGLQASTIGLALGGCTALGFFAGQWLDNRFGTGFWMPIMTMLGVAAGFREMFSTIRQVGRHAEAQKAEREANRQSALKNTTPSTSFRAVRNVSDDETATAGEAPRIFKVPAPPQASFDQASFDKNAPRMSTHVAQADEQPDDRSLTERLLDVNDDRSSSQ